MQKVYGTLVTVVVSIEQGWSFLFSTFDTVLLKLCKLHCTCNCMLSTTPPPAQQDFVSGIGSHGGRRHFELRCPPLSRNVPPPMHRALEKARGPVSIFTFSI